MADNGSRSYSLGAYARLLRNNPDFRRLWLAQVVSELGDWLYAVAIYSLLLELTGQARSVGIAVVLQLLPQVFIAPTAGVLNDRLSRRRLMISADLARIFVVLSMLLVRSASMVWLVWVLLAFETVLWALFEPGRSAIIPNVARNEGEVLVANSLSSTTWAINFALGSGLGGIVAYHFGRDALFVINALSFIVSALLLARMRVEERHTEGRPPFHFRELVDFAPVRAGFAYIGRDKRMLATLSVKVGLGLMGAHWVILPLYGERIFPLAGPGGGALSMSLLLGSRGVGSLFGSFAAGYWAKGDQRRMRSGIFLAFTLAALGYFSLSFAPSLALACLAVATGHAGTSLAWVYSTTMLQSLTDDEFRGRVFSADFSGLFLVMSLLSYCASQAVDWGVTPRSIALFTAAMSIVPILTWQWCQRYWKPERTPLPTAEA